MNWSVQLRYNNFKDLNEKVGTEFWALDFSIIMQFASGYLLILINHKSIDFLISGRLPNFRRFLIKICLKYSS